MKCVASTLGTQGPGDPGACKLDPQPKEVTENAQQTYQITLQHIDKEQQKVTY